MNLYPKICNLCGGKVVYTSNSLIYGKEYGSEKMYFCTKCGAYVGTHKSRPKEALGLLADKEMRDMKMKCHHLFDEKWKNQNNPREARKKAYKEFAERLGISIDECHFGYFDMDMLNKAYGILKGE